MFTQVIALLSHDEAIRSFGKLEKLKFRGIMDMVQYVQLSKNKTHHQGTTTVLLRHDTDAATRIWLCGFFANA